MYGKGLNFGSGVFEVSERAESSRSGMKEKGENRQERERFEVEEWVGTDDEGKAEEVGRVRGAGVRSEKEDSGRERRTEVGLVGVVPRIEIRE